MCVCLCTCMSFLCLEMRLSLVCTRILAPVVAPCAARFACRRSCAWFSAWVRVPSIGQHVWVDRQSQNRSKCSCLEQRRVEVREDDAAASGSRGVPGKQFCARSSLAVVSDSLPIPLTAFVNGMDPRPNRMTLWATSPWLMCRRWRLSQALVYHEALMCPWSPC